MLFGGDNYYGRIDRVPQLFYVCTRFLHVCFVPIVPRDSWLVGESGDKALRPIVVRLPLNWRSVFMGWFRGALYFSCIELGIALVIVGNETVRRQAHVQGGPNVGGVAILSVAECVLICLLIASY